MKKLVFILLLAAFFSGVVTSCTPDKSTDEQVLTDKKDQERPGNQGG